jgi:hypothetical protein
LFDIPLAKYDNLDEYPAADEIKRALEAHLVNNPNTPKKPTASGNAPPPATANNTTTGNKNNKNNKSRNKKRKWDDDKDKEPSKSSGGSSSSNQSSTSSACPTCKRRHGGRCWIEHPEDVPDDMKEWWGKKRDRQDSNKDKGNKDKTSQ